MRKIVLFLTAVLLVAEENLLLKSLEESSNLATKTKINIIDMPSTVNVMQPEDIARSGAKTLHDALGMIAGIEATEAHNGWKMITTRGVTTPNSYGFDKIKLMIDGVDVTNELYGTIYYYLDMPVELIERIEVLKGPASSVYGAGAFSGAINVITKIASGGEKAGFFIKAGDHGYTTSGAFAKWQKESFSFAIDAYMSEERSHATYPTQVGKPNDILLGGKSHHGYRDKMAGFLLKNGNFALKARIKEANYDNQIGLSMTPAPHSENKNQNRHIFAEASYESEKMDGFAFDVKLNYKNYTFDDKITMLTADQTRKMLDGFIRNNDFLKSTPFPPAPTYTLDQVLLNGLDGNTTADSKAFFYSQEESFGAELNLYYDAIENHDILLGVAFQESRILDNFVTSNYDVISDQVLADPELTAQALNGNWSDMRKYKNKRGFLGDSITPRRIASLYLQDQIEISDRLDLLIGARADHYTCLEKTMPSYRAGAVYRSSADSRIKLMLGHAYRVPSWVELYSQGARELIPQGGGKKLKEEKIDTAELSYQVKLRNQGRFVITSFYSTIHDSIDAVKSSQKYSNFDRRDFYGAEAEYAQYLSPAHHIASNLTLIETSSKGNQLYSEKESPKMADIATILANVVHSWYLFDGLELNSHMQYLGNKRQNTNDKKLSDQLLINESVSYKVDKNSLFRVQVRNLFDQKRVIPSLEARHPDGTPRVGRSFLVSYEQKF